MVDLNERQQLSNSMVGALLAVVDQAAGAEAVAQVLEGAGELRSVADLRNPDGWSSHREVLALFHSAAVVLDDPDVGRRAGEEVLRQYAGSEVITVLRSVGSPEELFRLYPAISAKQSTITESDVLDVGERHALISVITPNHTRDPIFCDYTAGALSQFPVLFGMSPAVVEETECQTRGDRRCLVRVVWDPMSSIAASPEHEVETLHEQIRVLTSRFESLESVARELASARDVDLMLDTITRRAAVAARAPRYLLVAQLPGDVVPRIHHVGFTQAEAEVAAVAVLNAQLDGTDGSRLIVDIASPRAHFGRLAAFYPDQYQFLPQERSLLLAYAGHAAAALETAAALDEARDRNATLSALLTLSRALAQESTAVEVAQCLADAAPSIVGSEEAHVLLWDEGDTRLIRTASSTRPLSDRSPAGPTAARGVDIANRFLTMLTPTHVSATSEPVLAGVLRITGMAAGVAVPIIARNVLFGVLVVGCDEHTLLADETLRERLGGVASLAATALDSVKLLDSIRHQALHDPLTGLANSRLFEDRVTHALSITHRHPQRHALLFIDLDEFKHVNDTFGHKVGDALLQAVASRLLESFRAEDTIARIGGDEFGVLVESIVANTGPSTVAQKVLGALDQPFELQGFTLTVGASVGVTDWPQLGDTFDSIIRRADDAMYLAKAAGRGRYAVAPQPADH